MHQADAANEVAWRLFQSQLKHPVATFTVIIVGYSKPLLTKLFADWASIVDEAHGFRVGVEREDLIKISIFPARATKSLRLKDRVF